MAVITLTTDFGTQDWFVGTMKGVILGIYPRATIVDITHEIPPGDIRAGAFALDASFRYFPPGTVHVAVVDPGVGSARGALAVETRDYLFVGPDNGVLSLALQKETIKVIHRLENKACILHPVSRTFHGRDIFAPVAARLAKGFSIGKLGPAQRDIVRLRWPTPARRNDGVHGEVVCLDRFGNVITNLTAGLLLRTKRIVLKSKGARARRVPLAAHYQAVPKGEPAAIIGSTGLVEIFVNGGSAARKLRLRVGDHVALRCEN